MKTTLTAMTLALAVSVTGIVAGASDAQAKPEPKFYSISQGKWLPMSEHPLFKKRGAKKKSATRSKSTKRKATRQNTRTTTRAKRRSQQVAKRKQDPNESPIPRKMVAFSGSYAPGTIVIDHSDRRLYHVKPGGMAMSYAVGVGKEGFAWTGTQKISRKAEWPGWTPPASMRAREAKKGRILPKYMEGGPNNPLGARALYLGSSLYRIHGTNQPWSLGRAVSSGCIRMANNDVSYLYSQVGIGTRVVVRP